MSKHTPGPWRYDPTYEPDECPVIWNAAGDAVCTLEPDGAWSGEEIEANALLIAASPTMLDAIDYALHMLLSLPSGIDEDADENDTSPEDMVAHIGGLISRKLQVAKEKAEGTK